MRHSISTLLQSNDTGTGTPLDRRLLEEHFAMMNERRVNDVVLSSFYQPHTLTLLAAMTIVLIYMAFTR
jgi:hypothetical protein